MKYIKKYEVYRLDNQRNKIEEKFNKQIEIFSNIELSSDDETLFKTIFNRVLSTSKCGEDIKEEIRIWIDETSLLNEGFLNESFFDKLKERWEKAKEVSKKLSDKAEGLLGGILQKVKDAVSFIRKIGEGIKEMFNSVIEKSKNFFTEDIKGGKLKSKIEELTKTKKEGLTSDVKKIKEVIKFYTDNFLSKLIGTTEKNLPDFLNKEQEPVVESFSINEGGNVIATLVHKIEQYPPFSWLHSVAKAGEAGASAIIKAISDLTQKLGGPAFQLPVIAILVGIVIEQIVKSSAGGWLVTLAGTTPLGMAINGIKIVASFVSLIVAIDAIVGQKILGSDHGDHQVEAKS